MASMDPRLKVTQMRTDELVPYAGNAKEHHDADIDAIAASIEQFGFNDPIGIWHDADGTPVIVEGHGRVLAAKRLGIEAVPTIALDHLDDDGRRAYTHVHNQTTLNTGFDSEKLHADMDALGGFEWGDFGFSFDDVEQAARVNDGPVDVFDDMVPDDSADEPEPRATLGSVWQLGDHRLMCGSSTDRGDVATLMDGVTDAFLFTSPPYSDLREYNGEKDLSTDNLASFIPAYQPYCEYMAVNLGIKRADSEIVPYWDDYIAAAHGAGMKLMAWNVWDKGMCGSVGQQIALVPIRHEFVFMFAQHDFTFMFGERNRPLNKTWEKKPENVKDGVTYKYRRDPDGSTDRLTTAGDRSNPYKEMESVLQVTPEMGAIRSEHPATFPVRLPAEYIAAFTPKDGGVVAEPFGGSGTTIIACEQLGRSCRAMELDPHYCDVAIRRWEGFTGKKAIRIA